MGTEDSGLIDNANTYAFIRLLVDCMNFKDFLKYLSLFQFNRMSTQGIWEHNNEFLLIGFSVQ